MLGIPVGWWIAAGLFFLLVVAVLMSNIVIKSVIRRENENDHIEIKLQALFGLVRYHLEIPIAKLKGMELVFKREQSGTPITPGGEGTSEETIDRHTIMRLVEKLNDLLKYTRDLTGIAKQVLCKTRITEWIWTTKLGTGDAVWTAMTTGMAWSAKSSVMGVFSQMVRLQTIPQMDVQPLFNQTSFTTEIVSTAKIRVIQMLVVGVRLIGRIRAVKGGFRAWGRVLLPRRLSRNI
ncbi:DUF2953 domain-containing protein [Paenibacillus sambharensis]|nr:DUF2953 domain-containing protein [Paenibacillus sambharensis]